MTTTYTVQKGDTLWRIAQQHKTTVSELAKLNKIENPNLIRIGQVIQVPDVFEPAPSKPMSAEFFLDNLAKGGYDYMKAQLEEKLPDYSVRKDPIQPYTWRLTAKEMGDCTMTATIKGNVLTLTSDNSGIGASVVMDTKDLNFDMMYEALAAAVSDCNVKLQQAHEAASFSAEFFLGNLAQGGSDYMKGQLEATYPDHTVARNENEPFTWTLTAKEMGDCTMTAKIEGNKLTLTSDNSGISASVTIRPQEPYFDMMYEQLTSALSLCKVKLEQAHEAAAFSAEFFLNNLAQGGSDFMKSELEAKLPDYNVTRNENEPFTWTLALKEFGDATLTAKIEGNTLTLRNDNKGDVASVEIVPTEPYFDMMYEQLSDAIDQCRNQLFPAAA